MIMTSRCDLPVTEWRMNGHVKSMQLQLLMEAAATLLCLWLVLAVDSTRSVMVSGEQDFGSVCQALKLVRALHKESEDLVTTYKKSLEEQSELICKMQLSDIPDSNISGLEESERMASISTNLRAFFPHFRRVYDQQSDLQPPTSPLLDQLSIVRNRSRMLDKVISFLYRKLYPNQPGPEPAGGPTKLPPSQSIFQQKIYGCVVLDTYREFLSKVKRELRTLRRLKVRPSNLSPQWTEKD